MGKNQNVKINLWWARDSFPEKEFTIEHLSNNVSSSEFNHLSRIHLMLDSLIREETSVVEKANPMFTDDQMGLEYILNSVRPVDLTSDIVWSMWKVNECYFKVETNIIYLETPPSERCTHDESDYDEYVGHHLHHVQPAI